MKKSYDIEYEYCVLFYHEQMHGVPQYKNTIFLNQKHVNIKQIE